MQFLGGWKISTKPVLIIHLGVRGEIWFVLRIPPCGVCIKFRKIFPALYARTYTFPIVVFYGSLSLFPPVPKGVINLVDELFTRGPHSVLRSTTTHAVRHCVTYRNRTHTFQSCNTNVPCDKGHFSVWIFEPLLVPTETVPILFQKKVP